MGYSQSNLKLYYKLTQVMPSEHTHGFEGKIKPYTSSHDRDQFIYATITVISQNGAINLRDYDFRLLYSRRDDDHLVARIVAEKEGVIKAQIIPATDGKTQLEAFLALRRHVEIQLERILNEVPSSSSEQTYLDEDERKQLAGGLSRTLTKPAGPSSAASTRQGADSQVLESSNVAGSVGLPVDAPPAYGRAVKDWRSEEKKR